MIKPVRTVIFIVLALAFGLGMAWFFTVNYQAPPPVAPAVTDDDPRQIIIMSNADGDWDLYQLTLGTRAMVNLTNTDADEGFASYSADGAAVSYVSNADRAAENELTAYNMNADGSGQTRVVNDLPTIMRVIGNGWFDWDITALDGTPARRALVTLRDFNLEVYAGVQDESGAWTDRNITRAGGVDWFPAVAPDGRVLLSSDRADGANQDVYLFTPGADADSDALRRLTVHPADDISAAFSEDGRALFYSEQDATFDGGVTLLYTLDLADPAAVPERIGTFPAGVRVDVQWSAAGDKAVYMAHDGTDWEIYSVDGAGVSVNLTDNDSDDLFPAWR